MSKPSKNMPMPISHSTRRWKPETGSRSSRPPALTGSLGALSLILDLSLCAGALRPRFSRLSGDYGVAAQRGDDPPLGLFQVLAQQLRGEAAVAVAERINDGGVLGDQALWVAVLQAAQADAHQPVRL